VQAHTRKETTVSSIAKRAILIGLDGVSPDFVLRMIAQGKLPNLKRFLDQGVLAPHCYSSMPTSTPENWTSIATGAWNGAHQVMSFQKFQPEELKGRWMSGFTSKESQSEFIWDAAERAGERTILLKYPASWPPTMTTGIQVCGCHVRPCLHQLDGSYLFSTVERPGATMVELAQADGWAGLPAGARPMFETTIAYGRLTDDDAAGKGGLSVPVCKIPAGGKVYQLLVYASKGADCDRVAVCREKDLGAAIADMGEGEWSPWILDDFDTEDGPRQGSFRLKLEELSANGEAIRLFSTHVMDIDHYTFPPEWGRRLYDEIGPYITDIGWDATGHKLGRRWISEETFVELAEHQHQWFVDAIKYFLAHEEWSLCMTQVHCIDCINHYCLHVADPVAKANGEESARYMAVIESLHESLDRMVGQIMDAVDDSTVLVLVSDHGGLAGVRPVDVNAILEQAGLVARDADGGVDWARTRAHVQNAVFVNVNLKGRDPNGSVDLSDFERVRDQIVAALLEYVDDDTGLHPFSLVLKKEDARMLGLWGDPSAQKIGDVLFALRGEFGGNHGSQLSSAKWGVGSNTSFLAFHGAGIRRGERLERPTWLVDIVPTLCFLLDLPVPKDTHGVVLYQAIAPMLVHGM